MTPEEQRIAIAEACGWIWVHNHCFKNESFMGSRTYGDGWRNPKTKQVSNDPDELPDYLNDLNAMHEAEKMMNNDQLTTYDGWLITLADHFASRRATAARRAEAFLRTLNLWNE